MSSLDKYECDGQIGLFDYMEPNQKSFCWDNDINGIVQKLMNLADTYKLEIGKKEFRIWDHVHHLGYRLWLEVKGTKEELYAENFQKDINLLVADAKQKNIELTPMWGACMFFKSEKKGSLYLTTMFMDKARQKRK